MLGLKTRLRGGEQKTSGLPIVEASVVSENVVSSNSAALPTPFNMWAVSASQRDTQCCAAAICLRWVFEIWAEGDADEGVVVPIPRKPPLQAVVTM